MCHTKKRPQQYHIKRANTYVLRHETSPPDLDLHRLCCIVDENPRFPLAILFLCLWPLAHWANPPNSSAIFLLLWPHFSIYPEANATIWCVKPSYSLSSLPPLQNNALIVISLKQIAIIWLLDLMFCKHLILVGFSQNLGGSQLEDHFPQID